jgi:hypothetical protein
MICAAVLGAAIRVPPTRSFPPQPIFATGTRICGSTPKNIGRLFIVLDKPRKTTITVSRQARVRPMSAFMRITDSRRTSLHVRKVPNSEVAFHSITSSADANNMSGTFTLSAFAVLRLMPRLNLVGCSTGSSAGLAPCRMRATK